MFGKKARKIEELERTVECLKSALSSLEEDYIIYDYINEKLDSPKNKLEYHYMFVQIEENNGEYFAHVYKVTKRGY